MFIINVALGNTSWRLLFKDEEKARTAFAEMQPRASADIGFIIEDDFGQTLCSTAKAIYGLMFEDMDKTKLAHVEMALHQARTQNLATKMAQSDQSLRASSMMQGPAILNPMNGSFRPS